MLKSKFCVVGIDRDIEDYIHKNKHNYIGLVSNFKGKNYNIGTIIGKENNKDCERVGVGLFSDPVCYARPAGGSRADEVGSDEPYLC